MVKEHNAAGAAGARRIERFKRLMLKGLDGGDLSIIDEMLVPESIDHQDYGPGFPPGREGVKALTAALIQAIPDMQSEIEEIVAIDDQTWARVRTWGTFTGPYLGIPPTGAKIDVYVVESIRWNEEDRVVEHWGVADRFGLVAQMKLLAPQYIPTWSPEVSGPLYQPAKPA
ncbi:MAG: ester cyclase [Chloroflexota bacterium]